MARIGLLTKMLERAASIPLRAASVEHVRQVVHAVRRVGLVSPSRVACLEESVAVDLVLAASRLCVTWCHGVAADPVRLHAWVEVDHQRVAEPDGVWRYATLREIPRKDVKR